MLSVAGSPGSLHRTPCHDEGKIPSIGDRHGNFSPRTNLTIEPPERTWNCPRRWFVHGDFVRSPQFFAFSSEAPRELVLIGERGTGVPGGLWTLKDLSPLRYPSWFLRDHEGANGHRAPTQPCEIPLYATLLSQIQPRTSGCVADQDPYAKAGVRRRRLNLDDRGTRGPVDMSQLRFGK